jgi:HEAT repeat protein
MAHDSRRAETLPYWASAVDSASARRVDDPRASETRSTSEIIAAYLARPDDPDAVALLATLHYRGGPEEFRAGSALLASADPRERAAGADILGQLGWQDRTFLDESVDALLRALHDPADEVVQSAMFALGHRESERAIEDLLPFCDHASADFRYASVHGLMPHDVPVVVDALIRLSCDTDRDVRDWATFTLASQFESDSPSLRAALHERLTDSDPEVRGEALLGLARRGEAAIAPMILCELEGEFHGDWAVEAAELLGDAQFLPALKRLWERLDARDAEYFRASVQDAISACESGQEGADGLSLK